MSKQTWEKRKERHAYEPRELPDGRWSIKGKVTSAPCTRISALLWAFRNFDGYFARNYLFWEIAHILWTKGRDPDDSLLEKNSFSNLIVDDLAKHKYTAFGGCGSSGKSHVVAAWCIVCWLSAPDDTMVFITTTTMKDADQRIWGSVINLMEPIERVVPVRNRPSMHDYVYQPPDGKMKVNRGIFLVAAEKKKTKEAMGRFIGKKAPHIVLAADELGELSPAIMNAAVSNLAKGGRESFQATGMSNPDSRFDAFGDWSTPKDGWESVDTANDDCWLTKWGGHFRRLDALDSPHLHREKSYLPTQGDIDEARELLGANSRAFMRMWRAVFFDAGEESGVYSEMEFTRAGAMNQAPSFRVIGRVAGLDPSFTNGGDRCMLRVAEIGYDENGHFVMQLGPLIHLRDDTSSSEPRSYQIAAALKEQLEKYKIPLRHVAVDATGAGSPLCDVLDSEINGGGACCRVSFGSSPSDLRPNPRVRRTAKEMYANRVTELWFAGKEFLRCKQLFGFDGETVRELTLREFDQRKAGSGLKVQLENKGTFKSRTSSPSPDAADCTMLALDSARQNFSFFPIERVEQGSGFRAQRGPVTLAAQDIAGASESSWL